MGKDELEYPVDRSASDVGQALVVGGVGGIPTVGGLLSKIVEESWKPRLERRREEWFNQLAEDVASLAEDVADLEARMGSEEVLEVVLQAGNLAVQAAHQEKWRQLRAAVLNTALELEPDRDRRMMFLALIDRLTPSHVRMLSFLEAPRRYAGSVGAAWTRDLHTSRLLDHACRLFDNLDADLIRHVIRDLDAAGLSEALDLLEQDLDEAEVQEPRTTRFGDAFLTFITAPSHD